MLLIMETYSNRWEIRAPSGASEWARMLDLRWRVLRQPWNQPRGSEGDALDATAVHRIAVVVDGGVVGTGRLQLNSAEEAQVRYMAVAERWRNRGVGGTILAALEAEAGRLGARRVVLNARAEAIAFYRRHGYRSVAPGALLFGAIPHEVMAKELQEVKSAE